MPGIQPNSTPNAAYDPGQAARDAAAGTPRTNEAGRRRSNTPPAERREIPPIILRNKRAEDAVELYGSNLGGVQDCSSGAAIGGILHQLRAICAAARAQGWKPVPGVTETVSALAQYARGATAIEKETSGAMLNREVATATRGKEKDVQLQKDIELLKKVIDRTLQGEDPLEVLGDLAETSLVLPKLTIREAGQEEPSQKVFDSTLLSFASGSYDHGPLGRTLLLEGGRARFAGPSEAQRADKLREVIFALPNPPESGAPLEGMSDIFQALMELGIDI